MMGSSDTPQKPFFYAFNLDDMVTQDYLRTRRQRKQVEMLFGHMKRILKVDRLRLRGLTGAQDEFLLTATAQNLRRMAKYLGTGPPVAPGML